MIRTALAIAIGTMVLYAPAAYAGDKVAGRALTTKSTKELVAQR